MIVVDSSALIAIVLNEPEREAFESIVIIERSVMSAVNVHESACVLRARLGQEGVALMWRLIGECEIEIVAFDVAQARTAIAAYGRYGKGVDPKARLNLADCAAYALAKTLDWPLLFKGADFSATDVRACLSRNIRRDK